MNGGERERVFLSLLDLNSCRGVIIGQEVRGDIDGHNKTETHEGAYTMTNSLTVPYNPSCLS